MRLRVAVQQQQRRPIASSDQIYLGARSLDAPLREAGKEFRHSAGPAGLEASRRWPFQFDGVAVRVADINRGAVALGAVALVYVARIDAVLCKMRLQRRGIEARQAHAK